MIQATRDIGRALEAIEFCVNRKEAEYVPESQDEFGDAVLDCAFAIEDRVPWRLVGEQIPSQCVRTVLVEDLLRASIVAK